MPEDIKLEPDDGENKKEIKKDDELQENEEEKEPEKLHLKTKTIPVIVMLTAGLIASVVTYIQHFPLLNSLVIIFVTLLVFLIIGDVIKSVLDLIEYDPPVSEDAAEEEIAEDADEQDVEQAAEDLDA